MRHVQHVLVAFGSNMDLNGKDPLSTLREAARTLVLHGMVIRRISRFYASPCFPAGAGQDYVNAAALVEVREGAAEILAHLHAIEARFGREREQRWGQRVLDLDLLAVEDQVLPDAVTQAAWRTLAPEQQALRAPEQLILPHPRMQDRAFVLVPLAEVAPDWLHPVLNLTVRQMLGRLSPADIAAVTPL